MESCIVLAVHDKMTSPRLCLWLKYEQMFRSGQLRMSVHCVLFYVQHFIVRQLTLYLNIINLLSSAVMLRACHYVFWILSWDTRHDAVGMCSKSTNDSFSSTFSYEGLPWEKLCSRLRIFCLMDRRKRQKKMRKTRIRRRRWTRTRRRKVNEWMKRTYSTGRECSVRPTTTTLYRRCESRRKWQRRSVKENASVSRSTMPNRKWWQQQLTVQRYGSNS